jgi:putative iron-regulated protein
MANSRVNGATGFEFEKHFQVQRAGCMLLGLGFVLGCAPQPLSDGERRVALAMATEQVILPTYAELSDRTAELSSLLDELASAPGDADLATIRRAYLATRTPFEEAEAFDFGPATDLHSVAGIDQAPIDTVKIDAELASDVELTLSHVRALGANKRGLHALEYLLFPEGDERLEAALLADDAMGDRRRQFARSSAAIVASNAQALLAAWDPKDGDYAGKFSKPGGPSSVSSSVQEGLDTLLNETVVLSDVVANVKLGRPLGATTGGRIDPAAQESERASASLTDMLSNLRGVRNVYFGSRDGSVGVSLSSLVHAKSSVVDRHAQTALSEAETALLAIPEPLTSALNDSPEIVAAARDAVKNLKRVLATEVLGTLGASLKFSDNDGD